MKRAGRVPFGAIPIGGDVGRDVISMHGAVHGRVERIERLERVERLRVGVKQLTDERRTTPLVRQYHDRRRSNRTNSEILLPRSFFSFIRKFISRTECRQ